MSPSYFLFFPMLLFPYIPPNHTTPHHTPVFSFLIFVNFIPYLQKILSLPRAYAPRLDVAVHIRNSFQNFEIQTNISDIGKERRLNIIYHTFSFLYFIILFLVLRVLEID